MLNKIKKIMSKHIVEIIFQNIFTKYVEPLKFIKSKTQEFFLLRIKFVFFQNESKTGKRF